MTDDEFLSSEGVRTYHSLTAEEVDRVVDRLAYEPAVSQAFRDVIEEYATGPNDPYLKDKFFFVSLQSLAPIFKELGIDIRHYMDGDPYDVMAGVEAGLQRRTEQRLPKIAGEATVDGRNGLLFPESWLRSAGVDLDADKAWSLRVDRDNPQRFR